MSQQKTSTVMSQKIQQDAQLIVAGPGRDLVNQLLGQAQMADAFSQFSRTVRSSKLAIVKENKLYQQLAGMKTPHGTECRGTWEEFCGLLGISVDTADRDISNIKTFGEEALEAMGRAGIGYRELQQFRRVPEDERQALIEAAKSGDKEALMDMAEFLIAKHSREKAELQGEVAALAARSTDLSVERDTAIGRADSLAQQLQRRRTDNGDSAVPMVVADLRAEMAALVKKAELSITSLYPLGVETVDLRGNFQAGEWVEPTLRLGLSGLLAIRELVDGTIKSFSEAMGEQVKRLQSGPGALAFLDDAEIKAVAEEWSRLTATHQHEAALREYERGQAKPKGKGRPAKAPAAPKAKA